MRRLILITIDILMLLAGSGKETQAQKSEVLRLIKVPAFWLRGTLRHITAEVSVS